MKKILGLVALLAIVGGSTAYAQSANDTTITWVVTGEVCGVPNNPKCATFTCNVTAADPVCHGSVTGTNPPPNLPKMQFSAPNATTFGLTFLPCKPCGGSTTCTPLTVTDAQPSAQTATFASGAFTASQASFKAYFPSTCYPCFGGETPLFTVSWNAMTTGVVPTTTTTTVTTTTTTT